MSLQPDSSSPMGIFSGIWGSVGNYTRSALDLLAAKSLLDIADGEIGLTIDPYAANPYTMTPTTTTGSAGPTSIWRTYDMALIGVGAVLVFAAVMLRK